MRIKNAGDVGIELNGRILLRNGTIPLDIAYGPGIWLNKADNTGVLGFMGTQNNQNMGFYGAAGGWGFTYDVITNRVGIGNTSPAYTLDVTGNTGVTGNFVNTTSGFAVFGRCINNPAQGTGVSGAGGLAGVSGDATVVRTGNRYGLYGFAGYGTTNYGVYGLAYNGTTAYGIYAEATGAATNWAGYFSGNVFASAYSLTSDRKLKNDIAPLTGAISIIHQLNPSFYTFKTSEYKQLHLPEGIHYGLIADEVQLIIPGMVNKAVHPAQYENHNEQGGKKLSDKVEFNTINYTEMIPILIAAMKEQQVMIEELKMKNQKIDQQQQQLNELLKEIKLIKEKIK